MRAHGSARTRVKPRTGAPTPTYVAHMLRNVRLRLLCSLALAGLIVAGCASTDPGVSATRSRQIEGGGLIPDATDPPSTDPQNPDDTSPDATSPEDTTPDATTPDTTPATLPVEEGVIDFGSRKPAQEYDGFLIAAFKDIEGFWDTEFPRVFGAKFQQLQGGIFAAYSDRPEPIPGCGTAQTRFDDVKGNAFYCIDGDFMVYDDEVLLPGLVAKLGEAAVAVVLAHEFGHAVQARNDAFGQPTVLKEQQADCFAGAWAAHATGSSAGAIRFTDNDVRRGLIAMIEVADPVDGQGLADPDAHGTGFDRVGAFQDGFIGGADRCSTFFTEGRENQLIDIPFRFDDPNAGDLPLKSPDNSDIVTLLPADLDRFWTEKLTAENVTFTPPTLVLFPEDGPFPPCAGKKDADYPRATFFCPSTNQILMDEDFAKALAEPGDLKIGDMAVGYILSQAYSEAVQLALASPLKGVDRALLDDCLTGSWIADIVPAADGSAPGDLSLSAGDLDEAVVTAIVRSDGSADTDVRGTAFEKIDSFRAGVLGGLNACATRFG